MEGHLYGQVTKDVNISMGVAAKAWVAFVLSVVTGLQAIYVNNVYLTIAGMVITAVGVYLVPNSPTVVVTSHGPEDPIV